DAERRHASDLERASAPRAGPHRGERRLQGAAAAPQGSTATARVTKKEEGPWDGLPRRRGRCERSVLVLDLLPVGDLALVDAQRESALRVRARPRLEDHRRPLLPVV